VVETKLVVVGTTIGVQELHLVDLGNPPPLVELKHLAFLRGLGHTLGYFHFCCR
jgi:hypothetical protein